jgi:hypothetical protein
MQKIVDEVKVNLQSASQSSETMTDDKKAYLKALTERYKEAYAMLNDDCSVSLLKKLVQQRKAKRRRLHRKHMKTRLEKLFEENQIQQKSLEIDENLKKIEQDIKKEKNVSQNNQGMHIKIIN